MNQTPFLSSKFHDALHKHLKFVFGTADNLLEARHVKNKNCNCRRRHRSNILIRGRRGAARNYDCRCRLPTPHDLQKYRALFVRLLALREIFCFSFSVSVLKIYCRSFIRQSVCPYVRQLACLLPSLTKKITFKLQVFTCKMELFAKVVGKLLL